MTSPLLSAVILNMGHHQRIHDMPSDERPREKMLRLGPTALSGDELLAIFLRTGTKGQSAIDLGRSLIRKYGNLSALSRLKVKRLAKEHGFGPAKACQLVAAFELGKRANLESIHKTSLASSHQIQTHITPLLTGLTTEHLYVFTLDNRMQLIRMVEISHGSSNQTIARARDIFEPVILDQADFFILAHNHPSGNASPSSADHLTTQKIQRLAQPMGVCLVDHVIVGQKLNGASSYYSFRAETDYLD